MSATDIRYTEVRTAADVTPEVLALAEYAADFAEDRIDWDDVWDRMDGAPLSDGSKLDLGSDANTPAMRAIKRHVNDARRE